MGWLSNVFCPPLGLGVSLQSLKCVGLPPTPLAQAFPRLAGTERCQRCGRLPPRMFLLSTEDCECVHLWFGWLFIGYANLLYPAGVMGWLSNEFCPPLGLGASLWSLECVGYLPTPLIWHFPDWRVLSVTKGVGGCFRGCFYYPLEIVSVSIFGLAGCLLVMLTCCTLQV